MREWSYYLVQRSYTTYEIKNITFSRTFGSDSQCSRTLLKNRSAQCDCERTLCEDWVGQRCMESIVECDKPKALHQSVIFKTPQLVLGKMCIVSWLLSSHYLREGEKASFNWVAHVELFGSMIEITSLNPRYLLYLVIWCKYVFNICQEYFIFILAFENEIHGLDSCRQ